MKVSIRKEAHHINKNQGFAFGRSNSNYFIKVQQEVLSYPAKRQTGAQRTANSCWGKQERRPISLGQSRRACLRASRNRISAVSWPKKERNWFAKHNRRATRMNELSFPNYHSLKCLCRGKKKPPVMLPGSLADALFFLSQHQGWSC